MVRRPSHEARSGTVLVPQQTDIPVPGLIRARLLMRLVTYPEEFKWVQVNIRSWPGANRFFEVDHTSGPYVAGSWFAFAAFVAIWGAVVVVNERSSRALPVVLTALLLSPAIVDLAGFVGRFLGVGEWPIWILLSADALLTVSSVLRTVQNHYAPKLHPLIAPFALGLLVLGLVDPIWGFMSPVFDARTWAVSPIGIAAIFGYLTGFVSFIQVSGTRWKWVGRFAC